MRQIREPDVIHRATGICIIDADYGYRTPRSLSQPHVDGNATRRAIQRSHDPVLGEKARVRG